MTPTQREHTKTPWEIKHGVLIGRDSDDLPISIADMFINQPLADQEANARFIVNAVNSHDELVDSLKTTLEIIDEFLTGHDKFAFEVEIDKAKQALLTAQKEG